MEKTDEKLASLIEKLQDAGFTQVPEIMEGAIRGIQWDGTLQLGFFGLFAGLFLISGIVLLSGLVKENEDMAIPGFVGTAIFLILLVLAGAADNPWLKVFDPQAAIYQRMVEGLF